MQTAKLFTNGRSQAIRLPKAYRFEGITEVTIEKEGDALVLRPVKHPSIQRLIDAIDKFDAFPERDQPAAPEERPGW